MSSQLREALIAHERLCFDMILALGRLPEDVNGVAGEVLDSRNALLALADSATADAPPKEGEPNPDTSTSPVLRNLCESLQDVSDKAPLSDAAPEPTMSGAMTRLHEAVQEKNVPVMVNSWDLALIVDELVERMPHPEDAPRITMTKSYLSGRQCCDFTIAEDDSETHEKGCPWRIVDEFAKTAREWYDRPGLVLDRVALLEEDMASSPIRRVEDAPGGPTQRALLKAAQRSLHVYGENDDTERGEAAWALAARIDSWILELDRLKGGGETDG